MSACDLDPFRVSSVFHHFLWIVPGFAAAWCAVAAGREAGEDAGKLPDRGRIPVLAWIGPPPEQTSVERYRELADAGFTHHLNFFPDLKAMDQAIECAKKTGIKMLVHCPELSKDPEGTARRYKDNPAVAGYSLRDEPGLKDFADLAKWVKRIQSVDRDRFCYINLFPNYANAGQLGCATYQEHVDKFVAEIPVQILSFDHYPIVGNSLRPEYYVNLEIVAAAARKAKKPFWAFSLAVAHGSYPIPTAAHLRLQVYSDLAYGAQGIQYFTYWTPESKEWDFHGGPIEKGGKRTAVYDLVKEVNAEIAALSGAFLGSEVIAVGHTGAAPAGTQAYKPSPPVAGVTTEGGGAVVSLLSQGSRRFLVAVNRDFQKPLPLAVRLDGSAAVFQVAKTGAFRPVEGKEFKVQLDPGDVSILTWSEKGK